MVTFPVYITYTNGLRYDAHVVPFKRTREYPLMYDTMYIDRG